MNLCLVNSAPGWGGGERVFWELATGLQQAGHTVTVICRRGSVLAGRLPASVGVRQLSFGSDLDLVTLFQLLRCFRQWRFDAVLCNLGRDCLLAGLAALPFRVPVVRVKGMVGARGDLRDQFIYRLLLSAVVSVSQAVHDSLRGLRLPANRLHVIHNGIAIVPPPLDRASARRRFGLTEGDFVVAYVGRLVREKGPDLLPDIAVELLRSDVPLHLLVLGDGPLRTALEAACAALGLGAAVRFLGFVEDPLPALLAADAAVVPSRSEAFCIAAVEALSMGTPLVAARVGGLTEIVVDEETGSLVPPEDPHALASALRRVYQQPELAARLRARGPVRAVYFSRARMVAEYEHLLRHLRRPGRALS